MFKFAFLSPKRQMHRMSIQTFGMSAGISNNIYLLRTTQNEINIVSVSDITKDCTFSVEHLLARI